MDWVSAIKGFKAYLQLERSLSAHSLDAYSRDVAKLSMFAAEELDHKGPLKIELQDLLQFIGWLNKVQLDSRSQARILSGVRAFYKFLLVEDLLNDDPTELLEGPRQAKYLPDFLSVEDVDRVFEAVDLSEDKGHRDRAILETLYACGLRVSELVNAKWSDLMEDLGILKVIGKGNKERLVPIGEQALHQLFIYKEGFRRTLPVIKGHEDFIFLNKFGKKLSRITVFSLVKAYVAKAGIHKSVSPHTFRHSFATHLVEGGASLRLVQEMLGHESITTTEIYTHLDIHYLRDTILRYHPMNQLREPVQ
ncbi:MAG: tyrosine recombinase XerD [Saprospiraceae bacterium]|nr:tyrosine recombinase XerD [Candidatus Vicinibacter proximus]HRG33979.1 site-specific tyrosine recombinase [Saprospiraceae bacterium]